MNGKAWNIFAASALFAATAPLATAQETGVLTTVIELEKSAPAADGQSVTKTYVAPDVVVPGDRVRVTLTFKNNAAAPAAGVNLVNAMPNGLVFDETVDLAGFGVSTDGGKSFGALATLTVPGADAMPRPAVASDVTHVRWLWADAVPPGQSRTVAFFGRVR